jgi:hypothetical protein
MSCKFYGTCAPWLMTAPFYARTNWPQTIPPEFRVLVTQGGNQCGLIVESYSPCRMETAGLAVDFEQCELKGTGRAEIFQDFERREFIPPRENQP